MFGKKKDRERIKDVFDAILDKLGNGGKIRGIGGGYTIGFEERATIRIDFESGYVLSFDVKDVEFRREEER